MTMRNALDFANDVAEAFIAGAGFVDSPVVGMPIYDIGMTMYDRNELMEINTTRDQREAALRYVLSDHFSEQEVANLLALRPEASEAVAFARALLTAAARTPARELGTSYVNEKRFFAIRYMSGFVDGLKTKLAPGHAAAEVQAPVH